MESKHEPPMSTPEAKHSPTPWIVGSSRTKVMCSRGSLVADCRPEGKKIYGAGGGFDFLKEDEANARLIARAPELLALSEQQAERIKELEAGLQSVSELEAENIKLKDERDLYHQIGNNIVGRRDAKAEELELIIHGLEEGSAEWQLKATDLQRDVTSQAQEIKKLEDQLTTEKYLHEQAVAVILTNDKESALLTKEKELSALREELALEKLNSERLDAAYSLEIQQLREELAKEKEKFSEWFDSHGEVTCERDELRWDLTAQCTLTSNLAEALRPFSGLATEVFKESRRDKGERILYQYNSAGITYAQLDKAESALSLYESSLSAPEGQSNDIGKGSSTSGEKTKEL